MSVARADSSGIGGIGLSRNPSSPRLRADTNRAAGSKSPLFTYFLIEIKLNDNNCFHFSPFSLSLYLSGEDVLTRLSSLKQHHYASIIQFTTRKSVFFFSSPFSDHLHLHYLFVVVRWLLRRKKKAERKRIM